MGVCRELREPAEADFEAPKFRADPTLSEVVVETVETGN
jgi:hypothetical protein